MKLATAIALLLACASTPLDASSPFDGVWKLAPESRQTSGTRFDIALQDGVFTCLWCSPTWSIPADGAFHPVAGQSGYDEASARIVDEQTAAFARKKDGRIFYQAVDVISKNGKYMAFSFTETGSAGEVETGNGLWMRVSPKPAGAHPVTGEWRELWVTSTTNQEAHFTISTQGDIMRIEFAPDAILSARLNGPAERIQGDPRGTTASLKRKGSKAFRQTDYRDGRIVAVSTSTLINPTTMEIVIEHSSSGTRTTHFAHKQ